MESGTRPSRWKRVRNWLLGVVFVVLGATIFLVPAVLDSLRRGRLVRVLSAARQFQIAAQTMALDGFTKDEPRLLWPADSGVSSVTEYCDRLIAENYLTRRDIENLQIKQRFVVTNLSGSDPGETLFLITKNYFERDPSAREGGIVIFRKGGEGNFLTSPEPGTNLVFPPREPAVLPAE